MCIYIYVYVGVYMYIGAPTTSLMKLSRFGACVPSEARRASSDSPLASLKVSFVSCWDRLLLGLGSPQQRAQGPPAIVAQAGLVR